MRSSQEKGALSGAHNKEPGMQSGNSEIPQNFPFFGARWAPTSFEWNLWGPYKWPSQWVTGVITYNSRIFGSGGKVVVSARPS